MGCYHPLSAVWTGVMTPNNKKDYVIVSGKVDSLSVEQFKSIFKGREYSKNGLYLHPKYLRPYFKEIVPVPCGRCIGCRLDYSRQWAVRCILESKDHVDNQFITLTYDDAHLPQDRSVHKRDLQLFLKRIRKYMKTYYNIDNIKYYACGEYGDKSQRPHYHLLMFGLPLPDKVFLSSHRGIKIYTSDIIANCWKFGIHSVGEVNLETAAYTARYVMKKRKGIYADWYKEHKLEPEFVLMSKKPGIGLNYFNANKDEIYKTDEIFYFSKNKVLSVKPCSYYDKKFDIEDPNRLAQLKELRVNRAVLHRNNVLKFNDFKTEDDYLAHEESLKKEQVNFLRRSL